MFSMTIISGTLFDPDFGECNLAENVDCSGPNCPPTGVHYLPYQGFETRHDLFVCLMSNILPTFLVTVPSTGFVMMGMQP